MANSPAAPARVVLAPEDPEHVRRPVEALDPFLVFLRSDARTPETVYRAVTDGLPHRVRLLPRLRTGWAEWEHVAAEHGAPADPRRASLSVSPVRIP